MPHTPRTSHRPTKSQPPHPPALLLLQIPMGPPGARPPRPAGGAAPPSEPAPAETKGKTDSASTVPPKAEVTASPSLWGRKSETTALASEPRVASFDQPLRSVSTLESLTKQRSHAPKGRRVPTKPVKVYAIDGSYRSMHGYYALQPVAQSRSLTLTNVRACVACEAMALTPELLVADAIHQMIERMCVLAVGCAAREGISVPVLTSVCGRAWVHVGSPRTTTRGTMPSLWSARVVPRRSWMGSVPVPGCERMLEDARA